MELQLNHCYQGDCRDVMRFLGEQGVEVQTIITSPPYFNLRDYGVAGQIGMEKTVEHYIEVLVDVFRHARRLLADDGTLWLVMGDTYVQSGRGFETSQPGHLQKTNAGSVTGRVGHAHRMPGYKAKDLMGVPWQLALALREDGWYLRQDIIWHKTNPMPESVRDRCTKAHEYLFLLSKSPRYYFDAQAIAEPVAASTIERLSQPNLLQQGGAKHLPGSKPRRAYPPRSLRMGGRKFSDDPALQFRTYSGQCYRFSTHRNKRSVWSLPIASFKGAHFAVFPKLLVEACVLAGSRPDDIVLDPFMGSGTVACVAQQHGRRWLGAELNPHYIALAQSRLSQDRSKQT